MYKQVFSQNMIAKQKNNSSLPLIMEITSFVKPLIYFHPVTIILVLGLWKGQLGTLQWHFFTLRTYNIVGAVGVIFVWRSINFLRKFLDILNYFTSWYKNCFCHLIFPTLKGKTIFQNTTTNFVLLLCRSWPTIPKLTQNLLLDQGIIVFDQYQLTLIIRFSFFG